MRAYERWVRRASGLARIGAAGMALAAAAACNEATAPPLSYPALDDVGQSNWAMVSVGEAHTCAIKTTGKAYCWGQDDAGQLGVVGQDTTCGKGADAIACSLVPLAVAPNLSFLSISAGDHHTCAITTDHAAYCWGGNDAGQLGRVGSGGPSLVQVVGTLPWVQISAGYSHTCAVRSDGALFCWGSNSRGELGNGTLTSGGIVRVSSIRGAVAQVSAGNEHTCARTTFGSVYCWGAVWASRQGGLEITKSTPIPQIVPGGPSLVSLSVGSLTTCGVDATGAAYCWEGNPRGEMGTGDLVGSTSPRPVASDDQFVEVTAGIVQSCGLAVSGVAYCWGDDTFGELGVSPSLLVDRCGAQNLPCSTTPVPVFGKQEFVDISTGFGNHTCGVTVRGNLYCWGLGLSGQRGDGTASYATSVPFMVKEPK